MIKTVTVERRICDICGKEAYEWTACLSCGKDLCPESYSDKVNLHAIRYSHGVSMSGSGDGYYCLPCDVRLSEDKSDLLHNAYVRIRALRDERDNYYTRQQKIEKDAEAEVVRLKLLSEQGL